MNNLKTHKEQVESAFEIFNKIIPGFVGIRKTSEGITFKFAEGDSISVSFDTLLNQKKFRAKLMERRAPMVLIHFNDKPSPTGLSHYEGFIQSILDLAAEIEKN